MTLSLFRRLSGASASRGCPEASRRPLGGCPRLPLPLLRAVLGLPLPLLEAAALGLPGTDSVPLPGAVAELLVLLLGADPGPAAL